MKRMTIAENNVKCGKIIIFDHKFYYIATKFPSNFVPGIRILSKKISSGQRISNKNLVARGSARGDG